MTSNKLKLFLAALCASLLATAPALAQGHQRPTGAHPQGPVGGMHGPGPSHGRGIGPGHGFPQGHPGFGLPSPHRWSGDIHRFDRDHWRGGRWSHGRHNGRYGWWWSIGPNWYFYSTPVYPYPDSYTPPGEAPGWWYWCDAYQEYYPYVTYCPSGWRAIAPR